MVKHSKGKLPKSFYQQPASELATAFLGKVLVHTTPHGKVSIIISEIESYPAFVDEVHHGLKKTARSEVMHGEGGHAYIYLIYGMWHQFSAVVNGKNIPDVVFIRGGIPFEGIKIMENQWPKKVKVMDLTNSPGKLCKSLLITKALYGMDLTGDELYLEDWGIEIDPDDIISSPRVGISKSHAGHDKLLRFNLSPKKLDDIRLNFL